MVFLLTRGEKQAAVFVQRVADRLPFVKAETVTSLVQKVADRMKILFTSSELLTRAGIWAAANWLLDAASLWVFLLAFGAHISPIDVLVAYGLANILAVIPLTPSGLGVIELTIVAVLKGFGVPGRRRRGGRPELAPGQLLAAHPLRRRVLPVAAPRASASAGRRQGDPLLTCGSG